MNSALKCDRWLFADPAELVSTANARCCLSTRRKARLRDAGMAGFFSFGVYGWLDMSTLRKLPDNERQDRGVIALILFVFGFFTLMACYPRFRVESLEEMKMARESLASSPEVKSDFAHVYDVTALTNNPSRSGNGTRHWILAPEGGYFDFTVRGYETIENLKRDFLSAVNYRVHLGPKDSRIVRTIEKNPRSQSFGDKPIFQSGDELAYARRLAVLQRGEFLTRIVQESEASEFTSLLSLTFPGPQGYWTPTGDHAQMVNQAVASYEVKKLVTDLELRLPSIYWDRCLAQVAGIIVEGRPMIVAVYSLSHDSALKADWPGKYVKIFERRIEVLFDPDGRVVRRSKLIAAGF